MGLYRGNIDVSKIYRGNTEIDKIYKGQTEIYSNTLPIIETGLILHLDANNPSSYPGTGTTWTDLSGNGNHVTLYNSPTYNGTAFTFDGVNDWMRTANTLNLSSTNTVTVEVGFKVPNVTTNVMVFEHTANWNTIDGAFGAYTNSNGGTASSPTTDNDIHTNSDASVADFNIPDITTEGVYSFIYESGVGTSLYHNNTLATRFRFDTVQSFSGYANDYLYLGTRGGTGAFGPLTLHYLRVYNRKLTLSEIEQNYNATKGRFGI